MREKAFAQLCERYGPFDDDARDVLRKGFERADMKLASGAHILLAALHRDTGRSARRQSHRTRDVAQDDQELQSLQRGSMPDALASWTALSSDFSPDEVSTYGLAISLAAARSSAGKSPISCSQLVRALLNCDVDIVTIASSLGGPATSPGVPSVPAVPAASLHWPTRREATVSRRYARRHHDQKTDLLNALAERHDDQVVLARGPFGSPLQRIEHMLADSLIAQQKEGFIHERLTSFRHVFTQNVSTLHAAGIEGDTVAEGIKNAVANLHHSLELAKKWHAMLILTRGEDLLSNDATKQAINHHLLGALLQAGTVPVVIAYEDQSEFTFLKEINLPFISCRVVSMPAYGFPHTLNFVTDNYSKQWEAEGISVEAGALDVLHQLERALHAPSTRSGVIKRKVLPYSATELLQEAVEAVQMEMNSPGYIRARALTAKERIEAFSHDRQSGMMLFAAIDILDEIIRERTDSPSLVAAVVKLRDEWLPCCETLLDLPEWMQQLADRPTNTAQHHGVVTREIVAAQLFAEPDYHLDVRQAFEESADSLDPRILPTIFRRSRGTPRV